MFKNIIIIGAARCGKTTLARRLNQEYGYSVISIDDIVSGLAAYPQLNIHHDGETDITTKNLGPFLEKYFIELSESTNFYGGVKFVIEGTHIDFERLMPLLQSDMYKEKYEIIGLTINEETAEDLYNNMKKYDTEDDWTYWVKDDELMSDAKYIINKNRIFNEKFKKYGIKSYETSQNREQVFNEIISDLKETLELDTSSIKRH